MRKNKLKTPKEKNQTIGSYIGAGIAIVLFQISAPHIFERPTGNGLRINAMEVFCATFITGGGGLLGILVVNALERAKN